ncbi:hypothetical protein MTO96_041211 [Rhipicephalus appendiculatus]
MTVVGGFRLRGVSYSSSLNDISSLRDIVAQRSLRIKIHGCDLGLPPCRSVWHILYPGTSVAECIAGCCAEHEVNRCLLSHSPPLGHHQGEDVSAIAGLMKCSEKIQDARLQ